MPNFNGDVVFVDSSGQVRSQTGDLTLRADSTNLRDVVVGSGHSLRPDKDVAIDLGRPDLRWHSLYAGRIVAASGLFNTIGPQISGTFINVGGSLVPELDAVYSLGTSTLRWANIFAVSGAFSTRPTVNGSGVLLAGEVGSACKKLNFTSSDGTDFLLTHGLGTQDWTWAMWRTDVTPHKAIIPRDVSPSGDNLVRIQLDLPIDGKIVLTSCGSSGVSPGVTSINGMTGDVTISTGGAASGAPSGASYLLKSYNDNNHLTDARILSATSGLLLRDQGARSTSGVVLSLDIDTQPGSGDLLAWGGTNGTKLQWKTDWVYVNLTQTFTTSSATPVSVTELSFAPSGSATYEFYAKLMCRTATANIGARPGLSWPTGGTDGVVSISQSISATAQVLGFGNINASVQAVATALGNNTQSWPGLVEGMFVAGVSPAGRIQIQLASETGGTNVSIQAGSFLAYRRIG